jgi:hypothetical protein
MKVKKINAINPNTEQIKQVRGILDSLKTCDVYGNDETGFSFDRTAIENIFRMTANRTVGDILLRLTVIDSMYSTQMNRRYYALQELAEKLHSLDQKKGLSNLFKVFIEENRDASLFNGKIGGKDFNLFANNYGIGKDASEKGVAVSLISKYAYFETHYEFPIYDSIVCEMYPKIWNYCGFGDKEYKLTIKYNASKMAGDKTIVSFTKAIDDLIIHLGGDISYDNLDRMMWFVGKILRGNLSLILNREKYMWCVENWFKKGKKVPFDITNDDIEKAQFCKNNPRLKAMFKLAMSLS